MEIFLGFIGSEGMDIFLGFVDLVFTGSSFLHHTHIKVFINHDNTVFNLGKLPRSKK